MVAVSINARHFCALHRGEKFNKSTAQVCLFFSVLSNLFSSKLISRHSATGHVPRPAHENDCVLCSGSARDRSTCLFRRTYSRFSYLLLCVAVRQQRFNIRDRSNRETNYLIVTIDFFSLACLNIILLPYSRFFIEFIEITNVISKCLLFKLVFVC